MDNEQPELPTALVDAMADMYLDLMQKRINELPLTDDERRTLDSWLKQEGDGE